MAHPTGKKTTFQRQVTFSGNQLVGAATWYPERCGHRAVPLLAPVSEWTAGGTSRGGPLPIWAESHLQKATGTQPHETFPEGQDSLSVAVLIVTLGV